MFLCRHRGPNLRRRRCRHLRRKLFKGIRVSSERIPLNVCDGWFVFLILIRIHVLVAVVIVVVVVTFIAVSTSTSHINNKTTPTQFLRLQQVRVKRVCIWFSGCKRKHNAYNMYWFSSAKVHVYTRLGKRVYFWFAVAKAQAPPSFFAHDHRVNEKFW